MVGRSNPEPTDEDAIRATHQRMIEAWNAGDGAAFAAPFTLDDLDSLPAQAQREVSDLVASLKKRHR